MPCPIRIHVRAFLLQKETSPFQKVIISDSSPLLQVYWCCLAGCEIREEDMDKLFDPFFTTKFTGRSLGLPVVLRIVKAHDSVITVENRINGGSVFNVFFPLSTRG